MFLVKISYFRKLYKIYVYLIYNYKYIKPGDYRRDVKKTKTKGLWSSSFISLT